MGATTRQLERLVELIQDPVGLGNKLDKLAKAESSLKSAFKEVNAARAASARENLAAITELTNRELALTADQASVRDLLAKADEAWTALHQARDELALRARQFEQKQGEASAELASREATLASAHATMIRDTDLREAALARHSAEVTAGLDELSRREAALATESARHSRRSALLAATLKEM